MSDIVGDLSRELMDEMDRNERVDPRAVPVRFSHLKQMALSPAHYLEAVRTDRPDTLSMRLGRGVHSLLLDMPQRIAVFEGKTRNGKVWDAFKAEHEGKEILNRREHAQATAVATAIRNDKEASRLLFDGTTMERRIDWSYMGRACRSTPDAFSPTWVVDLKTARTSEPDRFVRQATWMSYHAQLAFYVGALRYSGLAAPSEAYLIAVESTPPHPVTVLRLTERALEYGERKVRLWFERLLSCEATNKWPGYVQSVSDFDVLDDDTNDELVFGEMPDETSTEAA